ncbi:hypothetical protein [Microcystis sp.]|jgi:hypothetical protein|uniref:hypothetical protein n=1 Tax=Microcystis sp. TaxID=1127 RepID=UPI003918BA9D
MIFLLTLALISLSISYNVHGEIISLSTCLLGLFCGLLSLFFTPLPVKVFILVTLVLFHWDFQP